MKLPDWRGDLLLAGAILVFNLLFLGHTGLYDVDEAIFGEATREMVETGDFITPTYNYDVRWDKPPLIYWVMAGPLALFGPTSFGARFASACNGALLGLLLMAFGRAYLSPAAGRWAAVVLATCLHGFMLGHMSLTDMTLSLFMAASWMALFAASERGSVKWMLLAGVALGLGTLTKGPVAVVLPVAVWLLYSLLRRELLRTCDRTHIWWGVLLYCAVVAPWCWAIYERHGTAFFESFLGYHNLDRFSQQQSGHGGPVYTFVLVVLVGLTPWGGFMLSGLAAAARRWMDGAEGRAAAYLALWLGAVVGLFSLSQTKLPNYIAPCYPAAALLAGWAVARTLAAPARRVGWIVGPSLLGLGVLGVVLATLGSWLPRLELLRRELPGAVITTGAGPLLAGLVALATALWAAWRWRRGEPRRAALATAAAGGLTWLAVWVGVMPVVYHYQQGTLRVMTLAAVEHLDGGELATLNIHAPSIAFTARRSFTRYTAQTDDLAMRLRLTKRFQRPEPLLLIALERRVGPLLDDARPYLWAQRYGWQLLSNRPAPPGFVLPPSPWREADLRRSRR